MDAMDRHHSGFCGGGGAPSGDAAQSSARHTAQVAAPLATARPISCTSPGKQSQRTDRIVDLINHLQHPFHGAKCRCTAYSCREWDHTLKRSRLAMPHGAA